MILEWRERKRLYIFHHFSYPSSSSLVCFWSWAATWIFFIGRTIRFLLVAQLFPFLPFSFFFFFLIVFIFRFQSSPFIIFVNVEFSYKNKNNRCKFRCWFSNIISTYEGRKCECMVEQMKSYCESFMA